MRLHAVDADCSTDHHRFTIMVCGFTLSLYPSVVCLTLCFGYGIVVVEIVCLGSLCVQHGAYSSRNPKAELLIVAAVQIHSQGRAS